MKDSSGRFMTDDNKRFIIACYRNKQCREERPVCKLCPIIPQSQPACSVQIRDKIIERMFEEHMEEFAEILL